MLVDMISSISQRSLLSPAFRQFSRCCFFNMRVLPKVLTAALLLCLTAAAPTPEECVDKNKTLSAEELHTIFGKWILHEEYILSSSDELRVTLKNGSSYQTEIIPSENNQKVTLKQANMMDELCSRYSVNFTVTGNKIQNSNSTQADFFKSCDDCLLMRYSTATGDGQKITLLFFYTKTKNLPQADRDRAREQAMCLGFPQPPQFIYNQAELCSEQSDAAEA